MHATASRGDRLAVAVAVVAGVALVEGLGFASSLYVEPGLAAWYPGLEKPAWTPPDAAFPVVWTTLYALTGVSLGLLLARVRTSIPARRAVAWLVAQLAVNLAYAPVFFALRSTLGGLLVVLAVAVLLVPAVRAAWRVSRIAGVLLLPALAWVYYALTVSAGVWALNPS